MSHKIQPELYEIGAAAKYLGVSRSYFDEHLRKVIPMVDVRAPGARVPLIRYAKHDLDAFIASRRKAVA